MRLIRVMKQIKLFALVFAVWTIIGTISKMLFLIMYHTTIGSNNITDYLDVLWNGAILDTAIAGYLTVIPGVIIISTLWNSGKSIKWIWDTYFAIISFVASLAYVCNLGLYGHWGFPLDSTPLLYLKTSPVDAFASLTLTEWIAAPFAIILFSACIFLLFHRVYAFCLSNTDGNFYKVSRKIGYTISLLFVISALIIPIRGGFSTGTNHTGSVYFSDNIRLNHAAVNPIFSFVESVLHQVDFTSMYRFFDDDKAEVLFKQMTCTTSGIRDTALLPKGTNVIMIMLESFSSYIMSERGHVSGVVPNIEKLSREGIYFTNFYANSTRTDRAIVSIQSGLPAQPTMSVMDMPNISTNLPSIARTLSSEGYDTYFYYGGDTNYSNMQSYLVGTGYKNIVSDKDFPRSKRICKWGVPDADVYGAMLRDIKSIESRKQFYMTVMTASSHEPFDVPYKGKQHSEVLNAFEYADKCLGDFITALKNCNVWNNTLVVIVPDHLGAYPTPIDNYQLWRYEIPLILTGGAADVIRASIMPDVTKTIGSQIDLPATILGLLGINHSDFTFSKDLFNMESPHFAFFTFPDAMGIISKEGKVLYDNTASSRSLSVGNNTDSLEVMAKAYLQSLYSILGNERK